MKPAAFTYHAPREVEEALALLARHGDEGKLWRAARASCRQ
jgi:hypothetical protein